MKELADGRFVNPAAAPLAMVELISILGTVNGSSRPNQKLRDGKNASCPPACHPASLLKLIASAHAQSGVARLLIASTRAPRWSLQRTDVPGFS